MRARDQRPLTEALGPELAPRERVELLGQASVSTASMGEKVGVAVATAVLSGGMMAATVSPSMLYLVLTDRRLLLLRPGITTKKSKVVARIPRSLITLSDVKRGLLKVRFKLSVEGEPLVIRVAFIFAKADGTRFAESLAQSRV
ncbi:PH domain-containing protein [Kutzneria kofuensis]|uniref:PH (Pleckstrin Homology) domain-containing protein n=1 Tax=Kutzneria kofuensis TaxID=103725 RepID=A0A7W9KIC6_9PSEU|nr:PH domain-containing protein [Kutzneria kofuensis]MBB5893143.1 hypothetical protein [Kutzneria kofuensis]